MSLPTELLHADALYQRLLAEIPFPRYLNPLNGSEARRAFFQGAEAPPFQYATADLDEVGVLLRATPVPTSHPFGPLVQQAFDGLILLCEALMDRSGERFDRINLAADWYPRPEDLREDIPDPDPAPDTPMIPAGEMMLVLQRAMRRWGLDDWRIELDPVMSSRIMVESSKRLIHVNPVAHFRRSDLRGMVAHEIGVHGLRAAAGMTQPLLLFGTGLPGAGTTEEGLAICSEERVGALGEGFERRQLALHRAVMHARSAGFREVYAETSKEVGAGVAYSICARIKRGLGDAGLAGVYAKDTVYLRGYRDVSRWLAAGGDLSWLYTGKVGISHPIGDWIAEGLLRPGVAPGFWSAADPGAEIDGIAA